MKAINVFNHTHMKRLLITALLSLTCLVSFSQSNPQHKQPTKVGLFVPMQMSVEKGKEINRLGDSIQRAGYVVLDAVKQKNGYFLIYIKYAN